MVEKKVEKSFEFKSFQTYQRISGLLPKGILLAFKRELDYLGIEVSESKFVGFLFSFAILLSLGIALNLHFLLNIPLIASFPLLAVIMILGTYVWLSIVSQSKGRFVESILPDALQLIASNIKSGLTTERALFVSARPEFGPLEKELRNASKRILTGSRIENALRDIGKRIRSKTLEKTIWLINKGISSGGQMANILVQLADDIREQNSLQAEIKSNISIYVLLIIFAAAIGAPLMLGITSFIVQIISHQTMQLSESATQITVIQARLPQQAQFLGQRSVIDPEFIVIFAEVTLLATLFFASLTLGVINTGKEINGLKFLPVMLVIGFAIFLATRFALTTLFGHLLTA